MKMQPDRMDGVNAIARVDAAGIWVNTQCWNTSIVVPWQGDVQPWSRASTLDLDEPAFGQLATWRPEIVLFGSGPRLEFVDPSLLRALYAQGIGVETMDTRAACRTYNVLASEGRHVVAALLLPGQS